MGLYFTETYGPEIVKLSDSSVYMIVGLVY